MNAATGDIECTLGGRRLVLRPDFRALAEIEQKSGRGIFAYMAVAHREPRISELVWGLAALATSGGNPLTEDEAFRLCHGEGVVKVSLEIVRCLAGVFAKASSEAAEKKTDLTSPPTNPPKEG